MYKRYIPLPKIYHDVIRFVVDQDICNCAAIHVRRTDMELTHRRRSVTTDQEFFTYINTTADSVRMKNTKTTFKIV